MALSDGYILLNLKGIPLSFETERLSIRKADSSYAEALCAAATESIEEVFPYLPWCHPDYSLQDSLDWLKFSAEHWKRGDIYSFCIFSKHSDQLLGGCGLNQIDEHPVANLGYWIRSSSATKGYATEAAKGLSQFAFEFLDLQRVEIIMSVHNHGSRKVALNLSANYEGLLAKRLFLHGESHDAHLYSLIKN